MSDSESDSEYYNVEKIIAKEKIGNEVRYLVKWENFPEAECTWEPEDNLDNVKDLVDDFNNNINENGREKEKPLNIPELQKRKRGRPKKRESKNDNSLDSNEMKTKLDDKRKKEDSSYKEALENKEIILENRSLVPKYEKDIPERIISLRKIDEDLFCLTKWKCRNDGIQPEDCLVKNSYYKQKYPKLLIEYYESRVRFVNNK